jgi:ABC-type phosphate transport system substrate-binding protein
MPTGRMAARRMLLGANVMRPTVMWGTTASPSRRRLASTLAAFVSLATGMPVAAHAQVAVVVNPSNTLEELSLEKLRRLFLGQARSFPTGARARLAWHSGSAATFDRTALGLQPEVVRSRWMAMIFRGEAKGFPTELARSDDVKQFIRSHADAIGFLPQADVDGSVKVLTIEGKRPGDTGYVIR